MNLGKLTKLVDDKIEEDSKKIVIEYYKVITQTETSTSELQTAVDLMAIRLENLGYKVYREKDKYLYNDKEYEVRSNEVLVAIL